MDINDDSLNNRVPDRLKLLDVLYDDINRWALPLPYNSVIARVASRYNFSRNLAKACVYELTERGQLSRFRSGRVIFVARPDGEVPGRKRRSLIAGMML